MLKKYTALFLRNKTLGYYQIKLSFKNLQKMEIKSLWRVISHKTQNAADII